jgi:uncharacterized delta-60 repeat protein
MHFRARSAALQSNGKIVVVGHDDQFPYNLAVTRLSSDGTLDAGFGYGGGVTTILGTFSSGSAVTIQPDARIVVAGTVSNTSTDMSGGQITTQAFAVARYFGDPVSSSSP